MGVDLTFDGNGLYFNSIPDYPRIKGKFQSQTVISDGFLNRRSGCGCEV